MLRIKIEDIRDPHEVYGVIVRGEIFQKGTEVGGQTVGQVLVSRNNVFLMDLNGDDEWAAFRSYRMEMVDGFVYFMD